MTDTVILTPTWEPSLRSPRRSMWRSKVQVNVRLPVGDWARLEQESIRSGISVNELARRGVMLLVDGHELPADVHEWLMRLAAANDMNADPTGAVVALVRHLADRYPCPRRLDGVS